MSTWSTRVGSAPALDRAAILAVGACCGAIGACYGTTTLALVAALVVATIGIVAAILLPSRVTFLIAVAALPLEAFGRIEVGFGIPIVYILLVTILFGMVVRQEAFWLRAAEHGWLWLFLALSGLSVLMAPAIPQSDWNSAVAVRATFFRAPIQLGLLLLHTLVFVLTLYFARERSWILKALKIYLGIGAILTLYAIYQSMAVHFGLPGEDITWALDFAGSSTYNYGQTRYYSGGAVDFAPRATFKESLHFAYYLMSFVPLAWALFSNPQVARRLGFGALSLALMCCLGSLALLLTFSRSGWGAFALAMIALTLILRGRRAVRVLFGSAVVIVFGLLLMRVFGLFTENVGILEALEWRLAPDRILRDPRVFYLGLLIDSVMQHPWLGVGVGNFAITGAAAFNSPTLHSAHGMFWAACADSGIPAMLALIGFFGSILIKLRRVWRFSENEGNRYLALGLSASLVGLLAQSLFLGDRPELHVMFIAGLAAAVIWQDRVSARSGIRPALQG